MGWGRGWGRGADVHADTKPLGPPDDYIISTTPGIGRVVGQAVRRVFCSAAQAAPS
jgi:hypothetical protein